jgi:L-lactate dehydrogenase complex protein LldE
MTTDKIARILSSGAEICTATDSSCLMQIDGGLRRMRAGVRTMHLAEILASSER